MLQCPWVSLCPICRDEGLASVGSWDLIPFRCLSCLAEVRNLLEVRGEASQSTKGRREALRMTHRSSCRLPRSLGPAGVGSS